MKKNKNKVLINENNYWDNYEYKIHGFNHCVIRIPQARVEAGHGREGE